MRSRGRCVAADARRGSDASGAREIDVTAESPAVSDVKRTRLGLALVRASSETTVTRWRHNAPAMRSRPTYGDGVLADPPRASRLLSADAHRKPSRVTWRIVRRFLTFAAALVLLWVAKVHRERAVKATRRGAGAAKMFPTRPRRPKPTLTEASKAAREADTELNRALAHTEALRRARSEGTAARVNRLPAEDEGT